MKKVRKKRTKTRRFLFGLLLLFGQPAPLFFYIGLPMIALGQLIMVIAYGYMVDHTKLATAGPYAFVRNPFYVGTWLCDIGLCIMCNPLKLPVAIITVAYVLIQGVIYYYQIKSEEAELLAYHGAAYKEYCSRVRRRMIPSLIWGLKYGGFHFSWKFALLLRKKYITRLVSVALFVELYWAIMVYTKGESYLLQFKGDIGRVTGNTLLIVILGTTVALYTAISLIEDWVRRAAEQQTKTE